MRGFLYYLAVARGRRGEGIGQKLLAQSSGTLNPAQITRVLNLVSQVNELGRKSWTQQGGEAPTLAQPIGLSL